MLPACGGALGTYPLSQQNRLLRVGDVQRPRSLSLSLSYIYMLPACCGALGTYPLSQQNRLVRVGDVPRPRWLSLSLSLSLSWTHTEVLRAAYAGAAYSHHKCLSSLRCLPSYYPTERSAFPLLVDFHLMLHTRVFRDEKKAQSLLFCPCFLFFGTRRDSTPWDPPARVDHRGVML